MLTNVNHWRTSSVVAGQPGCSDVEIRADVARVTHTLTTPGCPMERIIGDGIRDAVMRVDGIVRVDRELVWDPAWHAGMIARDAWA
jgi:metal-sulfur cluster biosynthetic enzyme